MTTPFFSIITATYNTEQVLPHLLESLAGQTCRDFEVIIQDGNSQDNTLAIAESFRDRLPALRVVSEPDAGIYDAWNKALPYASGEWVLFLGADDSLAHTSVLLEAKALISKAEESVLYACGNVKKLDTNEILYANITDATMMLQKGIMPAGHTAVFHKSTIFKTNIFDVTFRIAGDYEFLSRTWRKENHAVALNTIITAMSPGGVSDNPFSALKTRWEILRVLWRYFANNISVIQHIVPLGKGIVLHMTCMFLGRKKAPMFLDRLRILRGLPPIWKKGDNKNA